MTKNDSNSNQKQGAFNFSGLMVDARVKERRDRTYSTIPFPYELCHIVCAI